ncbi:MAG TPA: 4Fe-4S dicluster domain-containing protein [Anaerolineales bacterium]|nr:4Fe-4S dicluster domain-containing protein [Anaerolineales bacterium]
MDPTSLTIESARCTACMACELACSFTKEGFFSPAFSRIKVMQVYELGVNAPIVCVHCADAPCLASCPSEAMVRDETRGVVSIMAERCSACGECVEACPYGAVHIPPGQELAVLCDLCEGEPACAASCLYGALRYDRQPEAVYGSLGVETHGLGLTQKRWRVAEALAQRVGKTREAKA